MRAWTNHRFHVDFRKLFGFMMMTEVIEKKKTLPENWLMNTWCIIVDIKLWHILLDVIGLKSAFGT